MQNACKSVCTTIQEFPSPSATCRTPQYRNTRQDKIFPKHVRVGKTGGTSLLGKVKLSSRSV